MYVLGKTVWNGVVLYVVCLSSLFSDQNKSLFRHKTDQQLFVKTT